VPAVFPSSTIVNFVALMTRKERESRSVALMTIAFQCLGWISCLWMVWRR
jgi:hypothetical protein